MKKTLIDTFLNGRTPQETKGLKRGYVMIAVLFPIGVALGFVCTYL